MQQPAARSAVRASDYAYATLLEEIQNGALAPGTVLAESEQAARLGVSRTPAREAISRLVADGLVAQQSPRVTVVTDFDTDDLRELFEVRRALEESSARLAAVRSNPAVFAELAAAFAAARRELSAISAASRTEGDDGIDAYYRLISRFDAALDEAVDNAYFASALRTIRTHLVRARRLARDNRERLCASADEHRLIAEAIAVGDPELAAHATHVHLHNALAAILDSLDENSDPARGAEPDDR